MSKFSICNKITSILAFIAVGKHSSGLYFKKKLYHSSVLGGILTILVFLLVLGLCIKSLIDVEYKSRVTNEI